MGHDLAPKPLKARIRTCPGFPISLSRGVCFRGFPRFPWADDPQPKLRGEFMTEETRDRSSRATMFGRIVLKNKLVDEAALKKVMAGLPAGSDLGEALVSAGLISAQHAAAIQKKIDELKVCERDYQSPFARFLLTCPLLFISYSVAPRALPMAHRHGQRAQARARGLHRRKGLRLTSQPSRRSWRYSSSQASSRSALC